MRSTVVPATTGTREAFNKEILGQQTSAVALTAMGAQRNIMALRVRNGLRTPGFADYPFGGAMSDACAYFPRRHDRGCADRVTQAVGVPAQLA